VFIFVYVVFFAIILAIITTDIESMKLQRISLDRLDIRILTLLQADGRMTKTQIADQIGLSITPCCERIKKLESAGVIRGYHAQLDLEQMLHLSYFRTPITLNNYSLEATRQFEALVHDNSEIIECEAVLGDIDYQLLIAARDMDHYQQLLEALLTSTNNGFNYRTYPVSKTVKRLSTALTSDVLSDLGKQL